MTSLCSRSWPTVFALLACLTGCERGTSSARPARESPPARTVSDTNRVQPAVASAATIALQAQQPDLAAAASPPARDTTTDLASEPSTARQPPFRPLDQALEAVRATLRAMPETRALADAFRLFGAKGLLNALSNAGRSSQSLAPWQAATPAFGWSPSPGEELVILSGDGPAGATLIAYRAAPEGPRFAGSFTTRDEHAPILVAYKSDTRDELLYSTCWGCGGEGGALRLDDTHRLRFMPR